MKIKLLYFFVILFFLALPYYIFGGKMYLGGDDTRLFYAYPYEFLKNVSFFSWYNVSSVGINVSNQFFLPFLMLWSALDTLIENKVVLAYLAFSLPLVFGFVYFNKFVKELFNLDKKSSFELILGSLFYILSPIIIFDQLFIFLTTIWLLGVVPAVGYYYLRYLKSFDFLNIYKSMLICFVLAFALWSVPWLAGFLLPLLLGSIVLGLLSRRGEILFVVKRTIIFFFFIFLSQAFWLLGFLAPYFVQDKNSFAVKFLSKSFLDTFAPAVQATATGYIIYPLLGLFHRQIAFDFDWKLKSDFINFYDRTFFLNFIFIVVLIIGFYCYRKYLDNKNRKTYLFVLASFLLSLYFFTVNIGPLKDLFLLFGRLPGFVMFRNFYDKFAPGYIFIYSILITISLVLIKKRYKNVHALINMLLLIVIVLNFSVVRSTVNSPLWTTQNVYKTLNIPNEYLSFMSSIKKDVPSTNTILSIPFGVTVYTAIKDVNSDNVYVGISPVKIFSGVNDISGSLSFNFTKEADVIDKIIIERKYEDLRKILYKHNINYVLVTKNIPKQVLNSYIFSPESLKAQDKDFLNAITDKKILTSENGNYELYTTKEKNSLLQSPNLTFKKINSVKYLLHFKNLKETQELWFNDSFHEGWKLYLSKNRKSSLCEKAIVTISSTSECSSSFSYFDVDEISFFWKKAIFDSSQNSIDGSNNIWKIDPNYIKKNFSNSNYKINKDGSINVDLILYFKPQLYLYFGSIISFGIIFFSTAYLIVTFLKENEKK